MTSIPFIVHAASLASLEEAFSNDIIQMIFHAGLMVKFILFVLLLFSVVSWAIIFIKFRLLLKAARETEGFMDFFWENKELRTIFDESKKLRFSPVARLFCGGYTEFNRIRKIQALGDTDSDPQKPVFDNPSKSQKVIMDNLERSLKKGAIDQINTLERGISFLATTGNTAPFIGLFGTVWGIMQSFRGIGLKGSANLAVVAPGISEALIATAAGLAAAIPAVVAFNYFNHKISAVQAEMDIFTSDFLSTVERQFFKKNMGQ